MLRSPRRYATALFRPAHYRAARRIPTTVAHPVDFVGRYVLGRGEYPADIRVKTPCGPLDLHVYGPHDVITINEVFCREDYLAPAGVRSVVDLGANIGIASAYFLSRNEACRVWAYEPAPVNTPRLAAQLERFGDRVSIRDVAVGPETAEISFGVEPTGRFGSAVEIGEGFDVIRVQCLAIDEVLEEVLGEVGTLDLLKLDTEGLEAATVAAIRPDLAARIRCIVFESAPVGGDEFSDLFSHTYREPVNVLTRLPQHATP